MKLWQRLVGLPSFNSATFCNHTSPQYIRSVAFRPFKLALNCVQNKDKFDYNFFCILGIDFVKEVFDVDGAKVCLQIW